MMRNSQEMLCLDAYPRKERKSKLAMSPDLLE